jgi:hypothetical protein
MKATDYIATLTKPATLCADIRACATAAARHKCADPRTVQWRCDPIPDVGFQLHVSWPCAGDSE